MFSASEQRYATPSLPPPPPSTGGVGAPDRSNTGGGGGLPRHVARPTAVLHVAGLPDPPPHCAAGASPLGDASPGGSGPRGGTAEGGAPPSPRAPASPLTSVSAAPAPPQQLLDGQKAGNEAALRLHFAAAGFAVAAVRFPPGSSRMAFVRLGSASDAVAALVALHDAPLGGRNLKLSFTGAAV